MARVLLRAGTMKLLHVFLLGALAPLTGCANDYCENRLEDSEQDVMIVRGKLTFDYAGERSEDESDEHTYDALDVEELKIRDASKATGNLALTVGKVTLHLPMPLVVGTYAIEGTPPLGWVDPSSTLSGVRGGYRESVAGTEETSYGTATGSVDVLSTAPLSFAFTISGKDQAGVDFEGSGSVDSREARMEDPEFECND